MTSYPQRTTVPPETPEFGDRYKLLKKLGAGGMGAVYKASDTSLEKTVAVKILLPGLSTETIIRFQQEARMAAKLDHPNIVKVLDFGQTPGGDLYLIMDYVGSVCLEDMIKKAGRLPLEQALPIFIQIAAGLQHAHSNKVLHRDVKPSNIMISEKHEEMNVQLVDFGLAKLQSDNQKLTTTGVRVGSPLYMSPEQAGGEEVDERSDIYSMGCLMFKALTGVPPLQGETYLDTIMMQRDELAPYLNEIDCGVDFPEYIEDLVAKALEKDPHERFQSARDLKHALMHALDVYAAAQRAAGVHIDDASVYAKRSNLDAALDISKKLMRHRVPIAIGTVCTILPISLFAFFLTSDLGETKPVHVSKIADGGVLNMHADHIMKEESENGWDGDLTEEQEEARLNKRWQRSRNWPTDSKGAPSGETSKGSGRSDIFHRQGNAGRHRPKHMDSVAMTKMLQQAATDPDPKIRKLSLDREVRAAVVSGTANTFLNDPEIQELFSEDKMRKITPLMSEVWTDPQLESVWLDPGVTDFIRSTKLSELWLSSPDSPELKRYRDNKQIVLLMKNNGYRMLVKDPAFQELLEDKRFQKLLSNRINIKIMRVMCAYEMKMRDEFADVFFPMSSDYSKPQ